MEYFDGVSLSLLVSNFRYNRNVLYPVIVAFRVIFPEMDSSRFGSAHRRLQHKPGDQYHIL